MRDWQTSNDTTHLCKDEVEDLLVCRICNHQIVQFLERAVTGMLEGGVGSFQRLVVVTEKCQRIYLMLGTTRTLQCLRLVCLEGGVHPP